MNKIVKRYYPASKLPEDLREGLSVDDLVDVSITTREESKHSLEELIAMLPPPREISEEEIQEAVNRIRALRDEWD